MLLRGNKLLLFPQRNETRTLESFLQTIQEDAFRIEEVELSSLFLTTRFAQKLGRLLKHCKLTRISLQSCHVTSPDILNALFLRHHNTIAHFECINNASGMLVDAEFGNLESLTLQGSSFSHQKVVALSKSNNKNKNHAIRELDLGGSRFENTHISSVLLKFDSLETISFKCCRLSLAETSQIGISLQKLPLLRSVNLVANHIPWRVIADLIRTSSRLQDLDLSHSLKDCTSKHRETSNSIEEVFRALTKSTSLRALRLAGNNINDQQIPSLAKSLTTNCQLQHLDLSSNAITEQGLVVLNLAKNQNLQCLNLKYNAFQRLVVENLDQNYTIQRILHSAFDCDQRVDYVCRINQGGRKALKTAMPINLWPILLERADMDAMYYFLRQGPILF